jgi:hypothetical protein
MCVQSLKLRETHRCQYKISCLLFNPRNFKLIHIDMDLIFQPNSLNNLIYSTFNKVDENGNNIEGKKCFF